MLSAVRFLAVIPLVAGSATTLSAQTRDDTLAVLQAVERALHVPLAKPGAEGHFLVVGVAPPLFALGALVSETFGRLCVEGSRLTPELGIASIELTKFVIEGDTAVVQLRTTDGGGTSGTLDLWRLRRDQTGRWEGSVASGGAWEGETVGPTPSVTFCRGREPG
ncbi:MAG TPA: hypothetical protein VFU23_03885 [Gemmatimonadales bacterium]|nr:hypothetical protein [Gemmatimonadales bacterium]